MLHILLLILKIIGIILAAVIGLLLLMILLLLFVPIRYCIKADGELGEAEPLHAQIKVTWLLHIVNVMFSYPKAAYLRVRIFCFTIFDSSKPPKVKKKRFVNKKPDKNNDKDKEDKDKEHKDEEQKRDKEQNVPGNNTPNDGVKESTEIAPLAIEEKSDKTIWEKIKAFFTVIKSFFIKLLDIFGNIKYTIKVICDKIKKILENIQYYTEVLQSDVFKAAFGISRDQLLHIMRHIRPGRCNINLTIGTGDPASTGQILAVYGMFYPFIGNNIFIQADFENMAVAGDLYIKGKVVMFTILIAALKLYRDKNIRQLLKLLKREDA